MEWRGIEAPELPPLKPLQWLVAGIRGFIMLFGTFWLIVFYLVFVLVEKALPKLTVTSFIATLWGRLGLAMFGLKIEVSGKHMKHGGAIVANHVSWMDIFTLHSAADIAFVAKAEVERWPVVGFLASVTGTLFIERRATQAKKHQIALMERLDKGDQLCFFPEATSTDGRRVIPFKSTLFSVFHTPALVEHVWVQPATLSYFSPDGCAPDYYGWWGDTGFGAHVLLILGGKKGGRVRVTLHDPVKASDFATRKQLSTYCEGVVRAGLVADLGADAAQL